MINKDFALSKCNFDISSEHFIPYVSLNNYQNMYTLGEYHNCEFYFDQSSKLLKKGFKKIIEYSDPN